MNSNAERPRRLVALLAGSVLVVSACSGQPTFSAVTTEDRVLLVSSDERDGDFGPEALFEGRIVLTAGNCVVGEAPDGELVNLDFPAGTTIDPDNPEVIVLPFAELPFGEDVALGGGYSSDADNERVTEDLPDDCRQTETFHVYTVG